MEAEDMQKLAAKTGQSEKDVALALKAAKDDAAEAERLLEPSIFIVKGRYAAKTNRLNGGIIIIADSAQRRIQKVKTIATYDAEFAELSMDPSWEDIEKKVVDAEIKQNFVPAISHDLAAEMEFSLNDTIDEVLPLLSAGSVDELATRIRRIVCTCLGDSDVDVNCLVEKITPLAMKIHDKEIQPDAAAEAGAPGEPSADAGTGAGAPPILGDERHLVLKTDVILSPVSGTPVTTLNVGDYILVKITDTRQQAKYIADLLHAKDGDKMLPVRVPIRKIDRSESQRLVITTEFGPGVYGQTVVQEGLKIKDVMDGAGAKAESIKLPIHQILLIVGLGGLVLFLMGMVIWYVVGLL